MTYYDWNIEKNNELKENRNISFEIIVVQIENGSILDILEHPNKEKYGNQQIYIIEFDDYAYLVPFVKDGEKIFLKTIIPSRKATKKYLR
jgi:uncharacterized DUF497 family protein